ncbi:MAG: hypothetical protein WC780_08545 [Lentimicrobiaceae bacterium]
MVQKIPQINTAIFSFTNNLYEKRQEKNLSILISNDKPWLFTELPVEIWQRGGEWTFNYSSTGKVDKIMLDPENVLPDVNRKNYEWTNSN